MPEGQAHGEHKWVESGFGKNYKIVCTICNRVRGEDIARRNGLVIKNGEEVSNG